MSTLCTSIALNTLNAGYDFEDVANYLKEEFNVLKRELCRYNGYCVVFKNSV